MSKNLAVLILVLLLVLASPFHCIAQEEKGGDNLRDAVQNPISSLISLPPNNLFLIQNSVYPSVQARSSTLPAASLSR